MIEGRISCDKCGDSTPLAAVELSYNGIKFHNFDKFAEYSFRVVDASASPKYKNIIICRKCQDALRAAEDAVRDTFFKGIK